ncbi:hypothetical protein ACI3KS_18295 [Microbacterium sp. ZW T5_45]|uniref:hypothetical protein n=1 Tax=Microbacterium sp. ZW T5_45 TaxID=3378080 RepID=UPI003851DF44
MDREPDSNASALVPGVHRVIRVLDADEGPFRGSLVANGSGVAVLVDSAEYAGWSGWSLAGCEHVAGPLDLVRRADGHDVLLPWCVERVEAFLGRRSAADALLTAGEVSTLVVSLLRGMDEHAEHGDDGSRGAWWLTEAGRPIFVIGDGDDVKTASARIIDRVRRDCRDRALGRVLADVHAALVEGRARPRPSTARLARWESELFELAAPRALVLQVQTPERVRDNAVAQRARQSMSADIVPRRERRNHRERGRGSTNGLVVRIRGLVAFGADLLRAAITRVPRSAQSIPPVDGGRRDRRASPERGHGDVRVFADDRVSIRRPDGRTAVTAPKTSRRRALLVAGAAAAAVLAGGLLWPGGATGQSDAVDAGAVTEEPARTSSDPSDGATPSDVGVAASGGEDTDATGESANSEPDASQGADSDDPVAAAQALLQAIRRCSVSGDTVCGDAVAEGSAGVVDSLSAVLQDGDEPHIALIDVYGDVAVVRVGAAADAGASPERAADMQERMLVLIRQNENWLVRDAYDVADQPG